MSITLDLATPGDFSLASGVFVGAVALGWLFGRGNAALEKRYIRRLEWALDMVEAKLLGYRRSLARLIAVMAGRTFAESERVCASFRVPREKSIVVPDPQLYDHTLRRSVGRVYVGWAASFADATTVYNDALNLLGPPPRQRPESLADPETQPLPTVPGRVQLPRWWSGLARQWRAWRAEAAEQRKADRSKGWAEPGAFELLHETAKSGRHAADAVAERTAAHAPRHVPPLTLRCPMPRSCTP